MVAYPTCPRLMTREAAMTETRKPAAPINPVLVYAVASDGVTKEVKNHPWKTQPKEGKPDAHEEEQRPEPTG